MKKDSQVSMLAQKLIPFGNKFNPCRLRRNQLQFTQQLHSDEYQFEEGAQEIGKLSSYTKQTMHSSYLEKANKNYEIQTVHVTPQYTLAHHAAQSFKSSEKSSEGKNNVPFEEEDLTSLWNRIEDQQKVGTQLQTLDSSSNNEPIIETRSDSSFELSEAELQKLMQCEGECGQQLLASSMCGKNLRQTNRSNCIYHAEINEQPSVQKEDGEWGSWEDIVKELENISIQQKTQFYNNQKLICLANNVGNGNVGPLSSDKISTSSLQVEAVLNNQEVSSSVELSKKYGPWTFKNEFYEIYEQGKVLFIQDLPINLEESQQQSNIHRSVQEASRPLRKINWQVYEQKKPQVKALKSKRNCRMTLMEHGKDFLIFDLAKFALSSIREGTHAYFGIKALGDFGVSSQKEKSITQNTWNRKAKQLKEYLYLSTNGESLLETNYQFLGAEVKESKIKKFSIHLSMTKEKIAVCERFVLDENKEKREVIQVKYFDSFENSAAEYLGIIESKISNFSEQWYCDTIINIPKVKVYSNKNQDKGWEKFKIQLRLSETGSIVAELGIFDAESSVTNCILFGETRTSQFMMGTLLEDSGEINYILRIAGISPLMGFVAALSRKIFVISS